MTEQVAKLRSKVKGLEQQLFERNEELQRFQSMGDAADQKIQALSKIHNDKIRSLMNSIQSLKKQNATLQNQGKQHKRSKLISQLNKQIDDQDTVIDVLRNYIYKKEGKEIGRANCDNVIVTALTKGPERIRALSREELKIQIERLHNQILLFKNGDAKKRKAPGSNTEIGGVEGEKQQGQADIELSVVSQQSSWENANQELLKQLQDIKLTNESLKLDIKSNQKVIESLTLQLRNNGKLQVQLTTTKSELEVAQRKVDTLESLLKQNKEHNNAKIIELYEREIKVEELQLQSKQAGNKLNMLQQNHNILIEEVKLEKEKLASELQAITKENQRLILENSSNKKRQQEQKNKINEIRELNNKQKEELTAKLTKYEQQIQRILKESDGKSERITILQTQLRDEKAKLVAEKMLLTQELDGLKSNGVTHEEMSRLRTKEKQLQSQIAEFKKMMENGSMKDSTTGSDVLMMRIKSYETKIAALQKRLKGQGKLTEQQLLSLGSQEWYDKYLQLIKEFQEYKLNSKKQVIEPPKKSKKPVEIIDLDESQRDRLQNLSSGMSNMGLKSVDGRIINNYDSDFEFEIRHIGRQKKGIPKLSENDKELLNLLNSDIWEFIHSDKLGTLIDGMADQFDSNYEPLVDDDGEWDKNMKELQALQVRMRKGQPVQMYKEQARRFQEISQSVSEVSVAEKDLRGFDSDVNLKVKKVDISKIQNDKQQPLRLDRADLARLNSMNSDLPSSVQDLRVSAPESGQSQINLAPRRKASRDKGARLTGKLDDRNSDYEGIKEAKLKLGLLDSDVSVSRSITSSALKGMDSDVSMNFKRKR